MQEWEFAEKRNELLPCKDWSKDETPGASAEDPPNLCVIGSQATALLDMTFEICS